MIRVPEFHPDMWADLPGYEARGEPPKTQKPPTKPRVKRSVESLTEERDKLLAQRDGLGASYLPDDHGAHSGIRRRRTNADYKRDRRTDAELERFTSLTQRIDYLTHRIMKEQK